MDLLMLGPSARIRKWKIPCRAYCRPSERSSIRIGRYEGRMTENLVIRSHLVCREFRDGNLRTQNAFISQVRLERVPTRISFHIFDYIKLTWIEFQVETTALNTVVAAHAQEYIVCGRFDCQRMSAVAIFAKTFCGWIDAIENLKTGRDFSPTKLNRN